MHNQRLVRAARVAAQKLKKCTCACERATVRHCLRGRGRQILSRRIGLVIGSSSGRRSIQSSTMLNSMVCGVAKVEEAVINRHSAQSQRSEVPLVKSIEVRRISHLDLKRGAESAVAVFSLTDMPQAQGGSPNSGV
jgi:hypothetical protein